MRTLLVLLISSLIVIGCKKGKSDLTMTGTVSDATFNQSLNGATVKLYEVEAGGGSQSLIGSTNVGSDGSYSFTFPRNQVENYILTVEKNLYFDNQLIIPFNSMTTKEDNIRDISTTAKSWAKITLFNSNPQTSDHLTLIKQQGKNNCTECCGSDQLDFYGTVDTSFYCANDGNTTYQFAYQLVGTAFQGLKSGTTVAFDTTEILLQY